MTLDADTLVLVQNDTIRSGKWHYPRGQGANRVSSI